MRKIGDLQLFKADFFRALGNPQRIRILEELGTHERGVNELQRLLEMPQSVISQHLAILRGHHLVSAEKRGASAIYSLRDPLILELLSTARRIFENRIADQSTMLRVLGGKKGR
ncbi:MAG: metalloregulator ArsR/SmtB family transcription factor [bacterium]